MGGLRESPPEGGRTAARRAFLAGPDNVRVAVVETGFAGVESDIGSTILTTGALEPYDAPLTPWDEPDLQGIWTSSSAVGIPFERPEGVDGNAVPAEEHDQPIFRSAGGLGLYAAKHRLELKYAIKEVLREASAPGQGRRNAAVAPQCRSEGSGIASVYLEFPYSMRALVKPCTLTMVPA